MSVTYVAWMLICWHVGLTICWDIWLDIKLLKSKPKPENYMSYSDYLHAYMEWEALLTKRVQPNDRKDGW